MTQGFPTPSAVVPVSYAVLRYEGLGPCAVAQALGLTSQRAAVLERQFIQRPGQGEDAMRPMFARHRAHVRAVAAQGGYPVLPERRS